MNAEFDLEFWNFPETRVESAVRNAAERVREHFLKEEKMTKTITKEQIRKNKFYVASDTVFPRNWGHPTVDGAVKHAQELIEEQGKEMIVIVQIVRVVRRQRAPVVVEKI